MSWKTLLLDNEQYNYEYFQENNICRLCWSRNGSQEIMKTSEDAIKSPLYDKIMYCLDIDVTHNSNLNTICCECIYEIDRFYAFKLLCHETNARFQQIVHSGTSDNTIKIKIEKVESPNESYYLEDTNPLLEIMINKTSINNTKMDLVENSKIKREDNGKLCGQEFTCQDYLHKHTLTHADVKCHSNIKAIKRISNVTKIEEHRKRKRKNQRDYYQRKKQKNQKIKTLPKSGAQRVKEFRERQKNKRTASQALDSVNSTRRSSRAKYMREYRQRVKLRNQSKKRQEHEKEDSESEI